MLIPIVSFVVNTSTALLLFLITIGDLANSRFFTTFHMMKVEFVGGNGPQGGWLDKSYDFLTFGLWSYCEGTAGQVMACSGSNIHYTLESIPALYQLDEYYVPDAVRSFGRVTLLYIPATCMAFVAFVMSLIALWPRYRKRWLHAMSAFLSLIVTLFCVLLMIVVFTVFGSRKNQFEKHLVPEAKAHFGPGVWMTLALVPLTVFGSLFGAFAVCCPGRFERSPAAVPESKEEVHEPST